MKLSLSSFFIILIFAITCISKNSYSDTLVNFKDLKFHSDFEREVFNNFQRDSVYNYFKLYLSIDKDVTTESYKNYLWIFNQKLKKLHSKNLNHAKPKKQIKTVYNTIHDQLDKYDESALFSDIFETEIYQCVTSSMLYSFYLEQLEIPYSIEFIPSHVYLTAYPETEQIQLQTTNPNNGIIIYNQQFKANFINHLRDNKIISSDEYNNKSIDALFQEYYLQSKRITKKELAGALYYNLGLKYLEKTDFENAYYTFQKSQFLFPSEQAGFFMFISLAALMDKTSVAESIYANYLNTYIKLSKNLLNTDLITGLFTNMTYKQLHTNGNIRQYELSYEKVIEGISDTTLIQEIAFIYHSEMGNVMMQRQIFSMALDHYQESLKLKENNFSIQNSLIAAIISQMNSYRGKTNELVEFQTRLNQSVDSFPSLLNNSQIVDLKFEIALDLMKYYFQEKDIKQAIEQQNSFELLAENHERQFSSHIEENIESAYSAAAVFYYKNNQYTNAKTVVKKGLQYCPGNYRLIQRLNVLK